MRSYLPPTCSNAKGAGAGEEAFCTDKSRV